FMDKDEPEQSLNKLSEITYVDGKKHGEEKFWTYSGRPKMLNTYEHGVLNGRAAIWYTHLINQMAWEGQYLNGKKHGLTKYWDTYGRKQWFINMNQGERHGLTQGWDGNGTL
ncbi:toxin-antitoxin system YwqK family antitoxin, partial [Vibrio alginolyticus]